ncbi:MAG TPA: TonB-dependent receptor [Gemmatimonadales bacterium]|nr:TonB-dependent receptor [Gemmatimonadales bacterium]
MRLLRLALLMGLASSAMTPTGVGAQATTNAGVRGLVTDSTGVPIGDATVLALNLSNGERWQTTTDPRGRYYLDHLSVGGPYRLDVRAVGYAPAGAGNLFLSLGQRHQTDFILAATAFQLEEITVAAEADPRINPGRTGPAQIISQETISRLPVPGRDFTRLAVLSPQVTVGPNGGLSFAGQHERFNSLQIDGANNNDLFTCSCGGIGTPFGLRAFSTEAVKEIQVITAPFDVRYGNFAGGLVNAVTKSGSNQWEGSIFGYLESEGLTGRDSTGSRQSAFSNHEGGVVLGGPILRDRLAIFVDAGYQRTSTPQPVPAPTSDTTGGADSIGIGIRYTTLTRFQSILRNTHGVEPGEFRFDRLREPVWSVFGKATAQLGVNNRLELSHNRLRKHAEGEIQRSRGLYIFSSLSGIGRTALDATRLTWTAGLSKRVFNELVMARLRASAGCESVGDFPIVDVFAEGTSLQAGAAPCSPKPDHQQIWELTDNLGVAMGNHRFTIGTHSELISLGNDVQTLRTGLWFFDGLDSLEQALPSGYIRDLANPAQPEGNRADFGIRQLGLYVQDEWSPTRQLTITAGLRFDVPFFRRNPVSNPTLARELGIDNSTTPSGNLLWSPRLGVNWDALGRGATFVRGGVGLFAGRPPYFWASEVYRRSGLGIVTLACFGPDVPGFTLDTAAQPSTCASFAPPVPQIGFFDRDFRFPRNLKLAFGVDQRLPWGLVGTFDVLYTRWVNQIDWRDRNLAGPVGTAAGEGGRVMYGTVDPDFGFATPDRVSDAFDAVIEVGNASGDRAWSVTGQLQKKFGNGTELSAAYTWTDAKNHNDAPADFLFSNYAYSPVDGSADNRPLRTSIWSVPHKVTLLATANLPLKLKLGLFYAGTSGRPFTYRIFGDANADGVGGEGFRGNDAAYVPRDANDITLADPTQWTMLDSLIRSDACLERQRGRIVERNSCRSPWIHDTQARLTAVIPSVRGHRLELNADLFNVLNFFDQDWGVVRQQIQDFGVAPLLELVGYDEENQRGIYVVPGHGIRDLDQNRSRWRLQLSARYAF